MDYFSQIRDLIESDSALTARWIAISFQMSMDKAKELLFEFKHLHQDIQVSYLISGKLPNQSYHYIVVRESQKAEIMSKFLSISTDEIYGISKFDTQSLLSRFQVLDITQQTEIVQHKDFKFALNNKCGHIQYDDVIVQPSGRQSSNSRNVIGDGHNIGNSSGNIPTISSSMKETPEEHTARMFANSNVVPAKSKPTSVTNFFGGNNSSKTTEKASSKVDGTLSNKSTISSDMKETVSPTTSTTVSSTSSTSLPVLQPSKVNDAKVIVSKDEDEVEWDDGTGNIVPQKRKHNQAKSSITLSSDAKENMMSNDDENEEESLKLSNKEQVKTKKVASIVHGPMDDIMEDARVVEATEPASTNSLGKKTKRKLVEKVSMDEKGYLITEMVYEEVTDDEEEVQTVVKSQSNHSQSKPFTTVSASSTSDSSKKASINNGNKKNVPPPTNQKSMMSFFGKKAS